MSDKREDVEYESRTMKCRCGQKVRVYWPAGTEPEEAQVRRHGDARGRICEVETVARSEVVI